MALEWFPFFHSLVCNRRSQPWVHQSRGIAFSDSIKHIFFIQWSEMLLKKCSWNIRRLSGIFRYHWAWNVQTQASSIFNYFPFSIAPRRQLLTFLTLAMQFSFSNGRILSFQESQNVEIFNIGSFEKIHRRMSYPPHVHGFWFGPNLDILYIHREIQITHEKSCLSTGGLKWIQPSKFCSYLS